MSSSKQIYIIAGPNGAGKTTAAKSLLPTFLETNEFVNADEIARGISPFNPSSVDLLAGKLMIKRIADLLSQNKSFALETTLSGNNYVNLVTKAKDQSYLINLIFLYLDSPQLAKMRVANRVKRGGHNIDKKDIVRRYERGIKNLINLYLPLVDSCAIYDNMKSQPKIIAEKSRADFKIFDDKIWQELLTKSKKYD
jgi:predicted ABC-type ATPase